MLRGSDHKVVPLIAALIKANTPLRVPNEVIFDLLNPQNINVESKKFNVIIASFL